MLRRKSSATLRARRVFRRRKRQVEDIGSIADESLDKHLFKRLMRLLEVRRFLIGWLGLTLLLVVGVILQIRSLDAYYKTPQPISGGTFKEGIVGTFNNANPLYATGPADASVSRLIFAGLFKYDDKSNLVPDLAEKWTADSDFTVYTVTLKPNLTWHDGKPLTAQDVAFTYKMIQNPDARSYMQASWRGIKVNAVDNRTITFTLPNKLSAFPYSLTNGIVPEHILAKIPADHLRSNSFNTAHPIGAGPFKFEKVQVEGGSGQREERVGLTSFDHYAGGKPKLNGFVIKTFRDDKRMIKAYEQEQIDAMTGLSVLPDQFDSDISTHEFTPNVLGQVMVFFKTTQAPLSDPIVRNALVLGINKQAALSRVPYPLEPIDAPLLKTQVGYNKSFAQITNDAAKANSLLDSAGWAKDPKTGIRVKDGKQLAFKLTSSTNSEYAAVIQGLQKQWRDLGVDVQVTLQGDQEIQSTLALHSYDALLYAISIGPDPDVFAYWHSSQADVRSETRLNFSEYQSPKANAALEAGRTRLDPSIRTTKYQSFLETWQKDNPALALYQPRFLYVVRAPFYGFDVSTVVSATDRYANVENWATRQGNRY